MSLPDPRPSDRRSAETTAFARNLGRLSAVLSLGSMVAAGLLGAVVTPRVGPFLVMGATIYTGFTDVQPPETPYPWPILGLSLLGLVLAAFRIQAERRGGWALAWLCAGVMAVLPFVHLVLLWQAMPPPE